MAREFSQSNRKGRNTLPFFQKQKPETPGLALGVTLAVPAGMSGTRTSGVQVPAMRGRGRRQTDVRAHRPHWAPAFTHVLSRPRREGLAAFISHSRRRRLSAAVA